jgi:hypothetical protein
MSPVSRRRLLSHSPRFFRRRCMSFGDVGSFFSKSCKQKLVTTSSTHAETRAAFQLIQDIIFINYLCQEINRPISLPATILEDNQPVILNI